MYQILHCKINGILLILEFNLLYFYYLYKCNGFFLKPEHFIKIFSFYICIINYYYYYLLI